VTARDPIRSARRLVLKVGSAVLTSEDGHPDTTLMASLAQRLAQWRSAGRSVTIVSSGAVGAGLGPIGASAGAGLPTHVAELQAAAAAGVQTVIGPGRPPATLARILAGDPIGTLIPAQAPAHGARRRWIALSAHPAGAVRVDAGAARALTDRNASLLAKGVTDVQRTFGVGDVVAVIGPDGDEVARGLTNFSSDELRLIAGRPSTDFEAILGRRAHDEVIHRDHLVRT